MTAIRVEVVVQGGEPRDLISAAARYLNYQRGEDGEWDFESSDLEPLAAAGMAVRYVLRDVLCDGDLAESSATELWVIRVMSQ